MRSAREGTVRGIHWTAATSALVLSLAFLALSSTPALAVLGHPVLRTISTGAGSNPQALALDGSNNVYVLEPKPSGSRNSTPRAIQIRSAGPPPTSKATC